MIDEIFIENFKLFDKETSLSDLKKLNILTGINGRGKSTSLQPFLLFAQTAMQNKNAESINLNGSLANLGNVTDVKSALSLRSKPVRLGFASKGKRIIYNLSAEEENNQVLKILSVCEDTTDVSFNNNLSVDTIFGGNIVYIPADRMSPRLSYEAGSDGTWIGAKGEYSVQLLYNKKNEPVNDDLFTDMQNIFDDDFSVIPQTVQGLTEFWLSKMFGKATVDVAYSADTNLYILKFSTEKMGSAQKFKPTDVGFGYTYALPVLVAGLTCRKTDILIVENPEAHLHPAAQSVVAKFLSLVAKYGAQVFIETHSEHIINAVRIMTVKRYINSDDVNILYFDNSYDEYFKQIKIESNGKLSEWPRGFFDQSENDLSILLGV